VGKVPPLGTKKTQKPTQKNWKQPKNRKKGMEGKTIGSGKKSRQNTFKPRRLNLAGRRGPETVKPRKPLHKSRTKNQGGGNQSIGGATKRKPTCFRKNQKNHRIFVPMRHKFPVWLNIRLVHVSRASRKKPTTGASSTKKVEGE